MKKQDFLNNVYIVDGLRTAIGARFKGLKTLTAAQLGAAVVQGLASRNAIDTNCIDEVIIGNTVSAGSGQNIARQIAIGAGLPARTAAFTVNNVCGSGMQSAILAAQAIGCGQADIIIAGSTESATHSPTINRKNVTDPADSLIYDGLWCQMCDKHMGQLAEETATQYKIARQQQDRFAFDSHQKALAAQDAGKFKNEIVPVQIPDGKTIDTDEKPRRTIQLEKLAALPAAFVEKGTVTAGNSCSPCDGAAATAIVSGDALAQHKLKPRARLAGYATTFVDPALTFTAAISSITVCLKNCGWSLTDVDLFEISEAFAVQAIVTMDQLKISNEKVNIWGGDVALGHPLGAAGTRILVTLLSALTDQKKKKGIAAVCFGGGGSLALALEVY